MRDRSKFAKTLILTVGSGAVSIGVLILLVFVDGGYWNLFGPPSNSAPPERIIVVTIDTLRADHLRSFGYPRDTAPFIESLTRRGTVFTEAYSASSHTAPSHTSMFTSLYPAQHNVLRNHEELAPTIFSLAQMAETLGFEVAAFPAVKFLEGKVGFPLFDPSRDITEAISKEHWFRGAEVQGERVLNYLKTGRRSERFVLWLHFYDVHEWQSRNPELMAKLPQVEGMANAELVNFLKNEHKIPGDFFPSDVELGAAIDRYDRRLRHVDQQLERISVELSKQGLDQNLLWVITSDHGEGLGNHHYDGHGEELYNEQLHVPLVYARQTSPLADQPTKTAVFARSVDLLPTLADMFKFPLAEHTHGLQGHSLAPALDQPEWRPETPRVGLAQRRPKDMRSHRRSWLDGEVFAYFTPDRKLIERTEGKEELFHTNTDPYELDNLFEKEKAEADGLSTGLNELLDSLDEEAKDSGDMDSSPEALEELKALGYL